MMDIPSSIYSFWRDENLAKKPFCEANNDVIPLLTLAPCLSKSSAVSVWPFAEAAINDVQHFISLALISAPFLSKRVAVSVWPFCEANINEENH